LPTQETVESAEQQPVTKCVPVLASGASHSSRRGEGAAPASVTPPTTPGSAFSSATRSGSPRRAPRPAELSPPAACRTQRMRRATVASLHCRVPRTHSPRATEYPTQSRRQIRSPAARHRARSRSRP
jgi:hypothetical protein